MRHDGEGGSTEGEEEDETWEEYDEDMTAAH